MHVDTNLNFISSVLSDETTLFSFYDELPPVSINHFVYHHHASTITYLDRGQVDFEILRILLCDRNALTMIFVWIQNNCLNWSTTNTNCLFDKSQKVWHILKKIDKQLVIQTSAVISIALTKVGSSTMNYFKKRANWPFSICSKM